MLRRGGGRGCKLRYLLGAKVELFLQLITKDQRYSGPQRKLRNTGFVFCQSGICNQYHFNL